jgi:hypothetical protein
VAGIGAPFGAGKGTGIVVDRRFGSVISHAGNENVEI